MAGQPARPLRAAAGGRACSAAELARGLILAARHPRLLVGARLCLGRSEAALAEPAETGAQALIRAADVPIERIVSSPHAAALLVARAVARATGAPLHTDDRLAERDFGSWEGRAWATLPRAEVAAWHADMLHYRPGGGESLQSVLARVRRAWPGLASSADTTLLLTHAGPIACLRHIADGAALLEAVQAGAPYGVPIPIGAGRL